MPSKTDLRKEQLRADAKLALTPAQAAKLSVTDLEMALVDPTMNTTKAAQRAAGTA